MASAFGPRDWLGTTDGTTLVLSVEPAFLDRMLARVGGWPRAHVELQETIARSDPRLATIATLLWQELRESSVGTQVYAQAAITQFVLQLIRRYAGAPRSGATAVRMSPHRLQRVKAYVDENLAEDLSVEALARVAGMSPFHFAHAFSSSTGLPPHRYVVQRRLERAKSLLSDTDLSLTQIAHSIGFSQPSHFCVAFQKATQLAPSAFRKSC